MNLSANEIHLWIVQDQLVGDSQLSEFMRLLAPEELSRYQRFLFERDKRQFLITRAALRCALSEYFSDVAPREWTFLRNDYGRPYVSNPQYTNAIQFNLSHADGMIVIAICQSGDLGVDVENLSRSCEPASLANRFFSASEATALLQMSESDQRDRFFDLWTLKESYIKACGMGLAIPLGSFSFSLVPNNPSIEFESEREEDWSSWRFWQFQGDTTHRIALAYFEAGGATPNVRVGRYLPAGIMKFETQAAFRATLNL